MSVPTLCQASERQSRQGRNSSYSKKAKLTEVPLYVDFCLVSNLTVSYNHLAARDAGRFKYLEESVALIKKIKSFVAKGFCQRLQESTYHVDKSFEHKV